jgi:hypothetical protein
MGWSAAQPAAQPLDVTWSDELLSPPLALIMADPVSGRPPTWVALRFTHATRWLAQRQNAPVRRRQAAVKFDHDGFAGSR